MCLIFRSRRLIRGCLIRRHLFCWARIPIPSRPKKCSHRTHPDAGLNPISQTRTPQMLSSHGFRQQRSLASAPHRFKSGLPAFSRIGAMALTGVDQRYLYQAALQFGAEVPDSVHILEPLFGGQVLAAIIKIARTIVLAPGGRVGLVVLRANDAGHPNCAVSPNSARLLKELQSGASGNGIAPADRTLNPGKCRLAWIRNLDSWP